MSSRNYFLFDYSLKKIFVGILAFVFSLLICGNVFAMTGGMDGAHVAGEIMAMDSIPSEASMEETIDTLCDIQSIPKSTGMDCCNPDENHLKIGVWQPAPTEKIVKLWTNQGWAFIQNEFETFPNVQEFQLPPSTAPPNDRHEYSTLIGIVKNLN